MNQLTENKTNAKAVTIIFGVLGFLSGLISISIYTFYYARNIFDIFSDSFYSLDDKINIITHRSYYWIIPINILDLVVITLFIPFLFLLYAAVFHKKAKAKFLVPSVFSLIILRIICCEFIKPILVQIINQIVGDYSPIKDWLCMIFFGNYYLNFPVLIERIFEIGALVFFAAATIMTFTGLKSKVTSIIFKVSMVIGALLVVICNMIDTLIYFRDIIGFALERFDIYYLFDIVLELCYNGSLLFFFIALIIFFMTNKLPYKAKPKKVTVKVQPTAPVSLEAQLRGLKVQFESGAITEEEYKARKDAIIDKL